MQRTPVGAMRRQRRPLTQGKTPDAADAPKTTGRRSGRAAGGDAQSGYSVLLQGGVILSAG